LYGNLVGLPPLLIQVGTREVFLDEIERFAKKAAECEVAVELQKFDEMIHTWQLFSSMVPEGQKALEDIKQFIKKHS
jgi:acetyl esterase/lipase